jgi:hypothetical protein
MGRILSYYRHLTGFDDFVKGNKSILVDDRIYYVQNAKYPQYQENQRENATLMKNFMDSG